MPELTSELFWGCAFMAAVSVGLLLYALSGAEGATMKRMDGTSVPIGRFKWPWCNEHNRLWAWLRARIAEMGPTKEENRQLRKIWLVFNLTLRRVGTRGYDAVAYTLVWAGRRIFPLVWRAWGASKVKAAFIAVFGEEHHSNVVAFFEEVYADAYKTFKDTKGTALKVVFGSQLLFVSWWTLGWFVAGGSLNAAFVVGLFTKNLFYGALSKALLGLYLGVLYLKAACIDMWRWTWNLHKGWWVVLLVGTVTSAPILWVMWWLVSHTLFPGDGHH